jgi:multiple sugar transport system substrate-binding protein
MSSSFLTDRGKTLHGLTWDHSRGFTPMVATGQRFHELNPDVEVVWAKRSLQEFSDQPLADLAKHFDLLVIDHPWAGFASRSGALTELSSFLSAEFLVGQAANSVGKSHESYRFNCGQWALAIDAAAPVSAFRPDLLEKAGTAPPQTWEELIALGRKGMICCPSVPLDVYGNFLNLCVSAGYPIFSNTEEITTRTAGLEALERLKELASVVAPDFFTLNPIRTCEAMTQTDNFAYCPFTYSYSNYSRSGYARKMLEFGSVISVVSGVTPSTMLGGAGLAISANCKNLEAAVEYVKFVASPETQRGLYFESGGQPGHRTAWLDGKVNAAASNHFLNTLPSLDAAFVRPRYPGYLAFQERAGDPIHTFLRTGGDAGEVLETLNRLYRESSPTS